MRTMLREWIIETYLFFFKILFSLFKWIPIQDKVTFVVSFTDNHIAIYNQMKITDINKKVIFLAKKNCYQTIDKVVEDPIYLFEGNNPWHQVISIFHLATSNQIIVDNYYGFLAAVKFKRNVECIQIWHAAGAIKTFGYEDNSIKDRTKRAIKRFRKVYQQFDRVIVGSTGMGEIFQKAFHLTPDKILPIGIPRTDFFYNKEKHQAIIYKFFNDYKELADKKIVLYAPTFRGEGTQQELALDLDELFNKLKDNYVLLVRFHPSVQAPIDTKKYEGFVYDFSNYPSVNELLIVSDYLITDYSSIPYEYSLLKKPMIFYPYDLEQYTQGRGLWGSYKDLVPGPVVQSTNSIIELLLNNKFDMRKIEEFSKQWNEYSDGASALRFVKYLRGDTTLDIPARKQGMSV